MKDLHNNESLNAFLQELPPNIQQLIAFSCALDTPLEKLVDKADKVYEITYNSPQASSRLHSSEYQSFSNRTSELMKELAEMRIERARSRSKPYKRATEDMSTSLQIFEKQPSPALRAAAVPRSSRVSRTLFVTDHNNRMRFLIDIGIEVSLIPSKPQHQNLPPTFSRTRFGLSQDIPGDVPNPIHGADFLHEQKTSILWTISAISTSVAEQFSNILRCFPNLSKPLSTANPPKHQVFNYTRTNGPPCHSHPRTSSFGEK